MSLCWPGGKAEKSVSLCKQPQGRQVPEVSTVGVTGREGGQDEGTKEVKALPGKGLVKPTKGYPNEQTLRG